MEYNSARKKSHILPLAATEVNLEGIMLSEISRTKTNTVYHLYVESKKYYKLMDITKKKQTHRYKEQTSGYGLGSRGRQYSIGEVGNTNHGV